MANELQQATQQRKILQNEYCRKVDDILAEMSATLNSDADTREKKRRIRELDTKYMSAQQAVLEQLQQAAAHGYQAAADLQNRTYQPESAYPWNNQEELRLLRNIQATLEQEYKPLHQNFLLADTQAMQQISAYGSDKLEEIRAHVSAL